MRYRDNASEWVGASVDESMLVGTALYALVAGVLLCVAGVRSRRFWLLSMGAILLASSSVFLAGRFMAAW